MFFPLTFSTLILFTALANPGTVHQMGRTASAPVGASMAMLATLQDASVLPPEGTPEANRAIQVVIQFQSVFMKSSDSAVEQFTTEALTTKWPQDSESVKLQFRSTGWTSEVLEAFVDRYAALPLEQRTRLDRAFAQANMRRVDFEYLSDLFDRARHTLKERGQDIHEVFSTHRKTMPGKNRPKRKEQRDGDQSVYLDQGEGGADKRRSAIT